MSRVYRLRFRCRFCLREPFCEPHHPDCEWDTAKEAERE